MSARNRPDVKAHLAEFDAAISADQAASAQAPVENRGASKLVGSGEGLGARSRTRPKSALLLAHLGMMAAICGGLPPGVIAVCPEDDPTKTPEDQERLAAAEAKRERKRLRKEAAKTKAPNIPHEPRP